MTFSARNPIAVLFWSFGLYIAMHLTQYAGILAASLFSGAGFESIISGEFTNHYTILGKGLVATVVGIPFALLVVKYLWRRDWDWLRLRFNSGLLGWGLLIGILLPFLILLIVSLAGAVHIAGQTDRFSTQQLIAILAGVAGSALFTAVAEEVVFRGMAVREWAVKWGWTVAAVLGGIYFGAMHILSLINELNLTSGVWIIISAIMANFVFVAMYVRSRSLWLPIGFHAGWNFCLKAIIGTTVSGKGSSFGLFQTELAGRDLITGGKFGLEASIVALLFYGVLAVLFLRFPRNGLPRLLASGLSGKPGNTRL